MYKKVLLTTFNVANLSTVRITLGKVASQERILCFDRLLM